MTEPITEATVERVARVCEDRGERCWMPPRGQPRCRDDAPDDWCGACANRNAAALLRSLWAELRLQRDTSNTLLAQNVKLYAENERLAEVERLAERWEALKRPQMPAGIASRAEHLHDAAAELRRILNGEAQP